MDYLASYENRGSLSHVLRVFAQSILISFMGTIIGAFLVPVQVAIGLSIITLIMLIVAFFVRRKPISYGFLYTFTGISGITMYPVIEGYGSLIGAQLVSAAFCITALLFFALSVYAVKTKRDFSFMGGFLMMATLGLILIGLVSLFVPFGSVANLIYSLLGILIFSGWVIYDISQYKDGVADEWVPTAALNLYLNFINLFYDLLRLIWSLVNLSRD